MNKILHHLYQYHTLNNQVFKYLLCLLILSGCGTKMTMYRDKTDIPKTSTASHTNKLDYQSFYMMGNGGASKKGPHKKILQAAQDLLEKQAQQEDYLLFLGDNVHANNLEEDLNKKQLQDQIYLAKAFKGTTLFTNGEHDWNEQGIPGLEDLEDGIEDQLSENRMQPENGCPLEVIELNDQASIFVVDSQWYIEDWSKHRTFNDACSIKTREQLLYILKDEIRKARHKNVLIVMHHPMYTNGIYGGEIPVDVLYKPTSDNLFLPGIGFLYAFIRSQGGISKQDQFNPLMNGLMQEIAIIAQQAPHVFVLSAHERSQQYIVHEGLRQIISGTLSEGKAARLGKDGVFVSARPGFAELRLFKDGSSRVVFYELDEQDNLAIAFEKTAFPAEKPYDLDQLPTSYSQTYTASVYPPEETVVDKKYEARWGKHYRSMYGISVEAPTALLDTLYGGLKVERAGGGNQTQSLRLVDKNDKEYNMRALAKDPYAFLKSSGYDDLDAKKYFSATIPAELIEDFYTAAHPYGAFAIPRLAGAAQLNHTHPKIYYVPKQKALGDFNKVHGNRLYMIVEKPDDDFNGSHMFGFNEDVESTGDLFEKLREDEKNYLAETEYIRARIFDMLVGDWDRHEDQWRWAQQQLEDDEAHKFLAIPRDRDQVFANFDGKFLTTLQKFMGSTRQFGKYGPNIDFIAEFSESAINLDRALIQKSTRETWLEQARYLQQQITPEIVAKAFAEMPQEVHNDVWKEIQSDLLSRKQNLPDIVSRYYDHFVRFQTLKGTDKDDRFYIERHPNGSLRIRAYRIKDGEDGTLLFDRTFKEEETKEIWLYGLDDKDEFYVNDGQRSKIKLVISGGLGDDTYDFKNGQSITVYDQRSGDNKIKNKGGARFRINNIYENHIYDSERRPTKSKVAGLEMTYNPDLGLVPHLKIGQKKMGFERYPFTSLYTLDARYHALTQAIDLQAQAHFAHLFPEWNLRVDGRITSTNYTENFFGFGNNSTENTTNYDLNRIAMQRIQGGVATYYQGEYGTSFSLGAGYESIDTDVSDFVPFRNAGNREEFFTLKSRYEYRSVDDPAYTTRGMQVTAHSAYQDNLSNSSTIFTLDPTLVFWNAIDKSRDLVLRTAFRGQLRVGENIPFYQAARLGSETGLRSYRMYRFTGQQAFSGSADLLYRFNPLKTILFPLRINTYAGYDTGRVWQDDENSSIWHYSYGGGLHLAMGGFFKTDVSYFTGPEGGRFALGVQIGL